MKNRRNYYDILHVQPDAPREIIKASYRTQMQKMKLHPDLGGNTRDAVALNEAYATLSDNEKRAAYDQQFLNKLKKTRSPDNSKQHTGKSGKNRTGKQAPEYWKDQSVCPFCGTPKPSRSHYNSNSIECGRCNSPLKTVVRLENTGKSRRKLQRISHNAPIRIYTHPGETTAKPGFIRNLSLQGMQFTTTAELDDEQVIRITSNVLSATARVCYCKPENNKGEHVTGVQFLTLQFHDLIGTFFSGSA